MDHRPATPTASVYAANLQQTLKELRKKVQEYQDQLGELRSRQQHQIPQTPAGQINTLVAAFNDVTASEPFLPYPGSVLPALLALRKTHRTIVESRAFLASQAQATESERRRLETDDAALRDHRLLGQALAERLGALRVEAAAEADAGRAGNEADAGRALDEADAGRALDEADAGRALDEADAGRALDEADAGRALNEDAARRKRTEEMQERDNHYRKETSRLMKALDQFINDHLAAMLAAEELGGPVVGELMDVDPDDLVAGFNAQGKRKKKSHHGATSKEDERGDDKRQRRIDEIWERSGTARGEDQQQQQQQQQRQTDEVDAAGAEMRRLTEDLLNRLVESKGNSSDSYVHLPRESAAARFLIRSKVAEFHPRDAARIRLVDFGRELED